MLGRSSVVLLAVAVLASTTVSHAAPPKPKAKAASAKSKPAPARPKKGKEKDQEKEKEKEKEPETDGAEADAPDRTSAAEDAKSATKEEGVKSAGTHAAKNPDGSVKVKEDKADKEGVKTYKFETVEVEGRLKSPQVIYFLRRVRAEFDAGALGHRSFLGELSDSRRSAAFR
jgi:hypothetical protein